MASLRSLWLWTVSPYCWHCMVSLWWQGWFTVQHTLRYRGHSLLWAQQVEWMPEELEKSFKIQLALLPEDDLYVSSYNRSLWRGSRPWLVNRYAWNESRPDCNLSIGHPADISIAIQFVPQHGNVRECSWKCWWGSGLVRNIGEQKAPYSRRIHE